MTAQKLRIREFKLSFVTPAFLGDANQKGQWRTPPIKQLLRYWWRVAWWEQQAHKGLAAMREAEARLFGSATDDGKAASGKSQVRIRLTEWRPGAEIDWPSQKAVQHPEVRQPIDPKLYLGYGPVEYEKGQPKFRLALPKADQGGGSMTLSLAYPESAESALLDRALWHIHQFGTLGSRGRNGWGSVQLTNVGEDKPILVDLKDALERDWVTGIGKDGRCALIWATKPAETWYEIMRTLAEIKIGFRTQFQFKTGDRTDKPEERHWLSYPVTNHSVNPWRKLRLPNSLRFKVQRTPDRKYVGVIYHTPCKPTAEFRPPPTEELIKIWEKVHYFLDQQKERGLERRPQWP